MQSETSTDEPAEEGLSVIQARLNWKLASRDDAKGAQGLYGGEEIEEMHELSDAGLLDELFVFLEELGMMAAFEQMMLSGVKRILVPTVQLVLLYLRHPCSSVANRCMSCRGCSLASWDSWSWWASMRGNAQRD